MLINSILAVSGVLNFGLTDATVKYVAEERRNGTPSGVISVIQGTLWSYAILSVIAGLLVQILAPVLVKSIFKISSTQTEIAIHSLRIAGWGFQVRMFYSVVESICRGFERYDLESKAQAAISIAGPVIASILVYYGARLSQILVAGIFILGLGSLALSLVVTSILGTNKWLLPKFKKDTVKRTFSFGIYTWIQGISGMFVQQADKLIIASTLGAHQLTYYSVCVQLAQMAHGLTAKGSSFLFPKICGYKSEKNDPGLRKLFWLGSYLTSLAGTVIALVIATFSNQLLLIWLGEKAVEQVGETLIILAFGNAMLSTSIVPGYFMNGAGYVKGNTVASMLSGILITTATLILVPSINLMGAASSRLASTPVSFFTRWILAKSVLNYKSGVYGMITLILPFMGFAPYFIKNQFFTTDSVPIKVLTLFVGILMSLGCFPLYKYAQSK